MTEPLTPADCDLRDFPRMSIDIPRLFASGFNARASAQPLAWMVAHKLWYRSWHQIPAASLPADDTELCHLAEMGTDLKAFAKVRDVAMRGWRACDDGRLYHPVIAEVALGAWLEKLNQRYSSGSGNAARWGASFDPAALDAEIAHSTRLLIALNPQSQSLKKSARLASQRKAKGVRK